MANWEYRVESVSMADKWSAKKQQQEINDFQANLNSLGAQGWEMISYESVPMYGSFSTKLKGHAYLLFLKRPALGQGFKAQTDVTDEV